MSVPKKRQTKSRGKRRRSHNALSVPPYRVTDDGEVVLRHRKAAGEVATATATTSQPNASSEDDDSTN